MTLETFFEKFDQFADAPNAVAKMRELVLELAVQGKLVSQDPTDEPAEELFARIKNAKEKLIKQKTIKRVAVETNPSGDECESLPSGWLWTRLGNSFDVRDGTHDTPTYTTEGFPLITSKNIYSGRLLFDGANLISEKDHRQISERSRVDRGNILFAMIGSIGNPVIVDTDREFSIKNVALFKYYNAADAEPRFLLLYLKLVAEEMKAKAAGGVQSFVSLGFLRNYRFPLPPLAEQKRIVAKVDELMALCDRLEAQQQEREEQASQLTRAALARFADAPTPANLSCLFHSSFIIPPSSLRKSILTLAVQGKLVRFEAENDAQTVGDHVEFQNGYAFKSQWFKPEGMRLCRNVNVSHGVIDWRESAFVDDDIAKEFERFALSEGDIVLSLDRPLITTGLKVARIRKADLPCLLLQRVAKPVPKHDKLDMSYFLLWLNSSEFVDSIDPGRSNGVPHISTRQVQLLPFVLPPLAEQRRIVAKVEQLMALVDALETQLAASRATAANLLSALVAELTGSPNNGKISAASTSTTGRRGRPPKS